MRLRRLALRLLACGALVIALVVAGCGGDDDDDGAGSNAIEFIGRLDQEGPSFTGYGYVTHLEGVKDRSLFRSAPLAASEKTARLTFRFRTQAASRANLKQVFAIHSTGKIEFFNSKEPAGDFDNPDSFAQGERVASGAIDIQNIITVYAPNRGIADASGLLTLDDASDFDIGTQKASIGDDGDSLRVTLAGAGTRSDAVLPRAVIDFAAQAVHDD